MEVQRMNDYHKVILDRKKMSILIRKAIVDSQFTIEEISNNLNLNSSRVIYEWMNGTKLPSFENLVNLSLMFNMKLEDFVALQ